MGTASVGGAAAAASTTARFEDSSGVHHHYHITGGNNSFNWNQGPAPESKSFFLLLCLLSSIFTEFLILV